MSGLVTAEIETLRPYSAGKPIEELSRERGVHDAIKLASNENALGTSPKALAAARAALAQLHRYPDAAAHTLKQRLAAHLGVLPEELVLGNGSNEVLELLVRTFTTARHHIVFGAPSFVIYRSAALAQGVPFSAVPLRQGVFDLDAIAAAIRPETRLVFIANPNNPTGTFVPRGRLTEFLKSVPRELIVALDEAYFEYATDPEYPNGLELRSLHPRLVVLRTFSKAYGLASLRLGYAVCSTELVSYLERVRAPFNANGVAQAAAIAALEDTEWVRQVVELNSRERVRVSAALSELGAEVLPSQANFVLASFDRDAAELDERLLDRGVIVRAFRELPRSLRITLGTVSENDRLLRVLKELFES